MQARDLHGSPVKWVLPLAASLLMLAACGGLQRDPDEIAAEEMQEMLLVAPYGPAAFAIAENHIELTSTDAAEAGITLTLSDKVKDPIVVRFVYRDEAPLNLRLSRDDGFKYFSAAQQDHFILGEGYATEALFYKAGPLDLDLEIEEIAECGEDNLYCLQGGSAARTFSGGKLKNRLLVESYSNGAISDPGDEVVTVLRNSPSGEFGATLTLAETAGTEDFILEFDVADAEGVNLRIDRNGEMRYLAADRGWARMNSATELLFFTAAADGFELENVKLVDCDASELRCRTAEDFDELLPGEAGDSSMQRVIDLTGWVTRNADFALSASVANDMQLTGMTPSQIFYRYYEPSVGAGFCGGTAAFLARTLRSQGFDAFAFDFGVKTGNLTHVTTVVNYEGKFYLMDATFGGYFSRPGGDQPIDLFSVLDGAAYEFRTLVPGITID